MIKKWHFIVEYWHSERFQDYKAFRTRIKTGLRSRWSQIICRSGDSVQLHPAGKYGDGQGADDNIMK
jgi:hypothetical protein